MVDVTAVDDVPDGATSETRPAHRPSRRREIIEAATHIFARDGYVDAKIEDIAADAGVAATAIYYHFGGKEELFNQAMRVAMDEVSANVIAVRPDSDTASIDDFREVLRAGWDWWTDHPDAARIVARNYEGSTLEAPQLRREWEDRHLQRAYDYGPARKVPRNSRKAREQHAANALTMRVILDTILATQAAVMDGQMGRTSRVAVMRAVEDTCVRLFQSLQ